MSEKDKMIKLYEMLHGALSLSCYWDFDEDTHTLICMKDGYECWSVSRTDLLFDYITKDL